MYFNNLFTWTYHHRDEKNTIGNGRLNLLGSAKFRLRGDEYPKPYGKFAKKFKNSPYYMKLMIENSLLRLLSKTSFGQDSLIKLANYLRTEK